MNEVERSTTNNNRKECSNVIQVSKKDNDKMNTVSGNEIRLMKITTASQNNTTPSSNDVEIVSNKEKKRKNVEEHSSNKLAKGSRQQMSTSWFSEKKNHQLEELFSYCISQ